MTFLSAGVMRAAHRTSFVLLAAAALLTGCGTKDAAGPLIPGAFGRIRFVNLSFDVDTTRGKVNAILESVPFGVDIAYGRSTPAFLPAPATAIYLPILTGSRTLVLRRTADTSATVATFPLTIANGVDYTVYATGASPVTPFITTDTNSTPALGQVRKIEDSIYVSAAMMGGNSGGPLLDNEGRAIGVCTRVVALPNATEPIGDCIKIEHVIELFEGGSW